MVGWLTDIFHGGGNHQTEMQDRSTLPGSHTPTQSAQRYQAPIPTVQRGARHCPGQDHLHFFRNFRFVPEAEHGRQDTTRCDKHRGHQSSLTIHVQCSACHQHRLHISRFNMVQQVVSWHNPSTAQLHNVPLVVFSAINAQSCALTYPG